MRVRFLMLACLLWLLGMFGAWGQTGLIYRVQGVVLDGTGQPVPSALIQIFALNSGSGSEQSQETTSIGTFSFVVPGPGPFQATVTTSFATKTVMIAQGLLVDVVIRLSAPGRPVHAGAPTVSLNELEAPSRAKAALAKAEKALTKHDFARARQLANQAIGEAPGWGLPYVLRGIVNFTGHDYAAARSDFATALARDPANWLALTGMGKLYAATGNLPLAQHYLRQALQSPPVHWQTYWEMAQLDLTLHNYAGADAMATRALHTHPPPPLSSVHYLDGEADYYLHHFRRAARQFSFFLKQTPRTPATARMRAGAQHNLQIIQHFLPH